MDGFVIREYKIVTIGFVQDGDHDGVQDDVQDGV